MNLKIKVADTIDDSAKYSGRKLQMDSYRITIRNVDPETADMLREVAVESGETLGEMFNQAVEHWYERLPETVT